MSYLTKEETRLLQQEDLAIAKAFVEFCDNNHLLCYLCGGGCIGTIRHHGFIPWDDDLDFFMPRDDYEKLKQLWDNQKQKPFILVFPDAEYNDHNIFITVRDAETTMIKPYQEDLDMVHGVSIDIFPLDGCPSGKWKRKKQLFWALVYQLFCAQLVPENHGKLVQAAGKILLGVFKGKRIRYRIWKYAERKMTRYPFNQCERTTELCAGPRYMRNEYPQEAFASAVRMPFENEMMPVPVGYDAYLHQAFGDYMQLPPVQDRVASHDCFLDLDHPYLDYKGLKYCIKNETR